VSKTLDYSCECGWLHQDVYYGFHCTECGRVFEMPLEAKMKSGAQTPCGDGIMRYADLILDDLGYPGWQVKIIDSGGGVCHHNLKEIWIDRKHVGSVTWLLHEIAHIKHLDHSAHWADHFTALMCKYVGA